MTARILNGNTIRDQIYSELQQQIQELRGLGIRPGLATVLVGDNPASKIYVTSKIAACEQLDAVARRLKAPTQSYSAGATSSASQRRCC